MNLSPDELKAFDDPDTESAGQKCFTVSFTREFEIEVRAESAEDAENAIKELSQDQISNLNGINAWDLFAEQCSNCMAAENAPYEVVDGVLVARDGDL